MMNPMMANMNMNMNMNCMNPGMAGMGGMGGMPGAMPGMMGGMPGVMPGMGQMMPGMMGGFIGGNQMNNEMEEEWQKGFKMAMNEDNNSSNDGDNIQGPKMNVVFNTTQGMARNLVLPLGTTVEQALEKYLKSVGKPELIGNQDGKICFLFNAAKLKFGDKTPIEKFFKGSVNPKVVVNDINNLIGAQINILWKLKYSIII